MLLVITETGREFSEVKIYLTRFARIHQLAGMHLILLKRFYQLL